MRINSILVFFAALPLFWGCAKEFSPAAETDIPFSITVQSENVVRASLVGSSLQTGTYVFATGDKLYVSGNNGGIHGVLTLVAGEGTGTASFSGNLSYSGGEEPDGETVLTATLVGASQDGFFTIEEDQITGGPDYPDLIPYASMPELVQKYSHFTANFPYGIRKLTLTQQTVFLNFNMEFYKADLGSAVSEVDVELKDAGGTVIHSVSGVPLSGNQVVGKVLFSTALSADTNVGNAQIWVNGNDEIHCLPDFASDADLVANKYYNVDRNAIEPFTVEAPADGTGTNITFHSSYRTNVEYRKFTSGKWSEWTACPSDAIVLSAGEKVSFRGKNDVYKYASSKALFVTSNPVYVYGDLMSLVCDEDFMMKDALVAEAFKGTFQNMTKLLAHPEKDLILSALTLNTSCYESMFQGCTGLTRTPVTLPATDLANSCYYKMFYGCTALQSAANISLTAPTLTESCYQEMFSGCTSLTTAPTLTVTESAGVSSCEGMFLGCTSLTSINSISLGLSSTQLGDMCYHKMFMNCDNLTVLKEGLLPSMNLAFGCYWKMFEDCDKLATVPSTLLPAMELAVGCYARMFYKCKALTAGPDLPAITPKAACYFVMYRNCSALKYVKCMLYMEEDQRTGSEIPGYYKATDDPPAEDLRNFEICNMWSVFNKWLTSNASGYSITNNSTCQFVYNSNMPSSILSTLIAGARFVPDKWTCTAVAPS